MADDYTYIPKGGMCSNCIDRDRSCKHINFKYMVPLAKPDKDGVVIVRCNEYRPSHKTKNHKK